MGYYLENVTRIYWKGVAVMSSEMMTEAEYSREWLSAHRDSVLQALLESSVGVCKVMEYENKKGFKVHKVYELPPNAGSLKLLLQLMGSDGLNEARIKGELSAAALNEDILRTGVNASRVKNMESQTSLNAVTENAYRSTMLDPEEVNDQIMRIVGAGISLLSSKKYNSMVDILSNGEAAYNDSVKLELQTFRRVVSDVLGKEHEMPEIRLVGRKLEVPEGGLMIEAYESLEAASEEVDEDEEGDDEDE